MNFLGSNRQDSTEDIFQPKKGFAWLWEILDRDFLKVLVAGMLLLVSLIPIAFGIFVSIDCGSVPILVISGILGGMIAAPQLVGLIDTILRSLRDEPNMWWATYRFAWKRNLLGSLIPGAIVGLLAVLEIFAFNKVSFAYLSLGSIVVYIISAVITVGISLLVFLQIPMMDLGLFAMFKNAVMLHIRFFLKVMKASLVILLYGMVCYLFFPASLIFLMLMNTWFPILVGTMVLYRQLDEVFEIEKRLNQQNKTTEAETKEPIN